MMITLVASGRTGAPRRSSWWPVLLASWLLVPPASAQPGSWIIPSSALRGGVNNAVFQTDVRILNLGAAPVTVTPAFYDQQSGSAISAPPFTVPARSQVAYDNVLHTLFGRVLANASFGPIRLDATAPIVVSSSVNNVNACGAGALSGQWLPAIDATQALTAGAIPQLAVSASTSTGYRTNLVLVNPGTLSATASIRVRQGGGGLLSSGTIGPLPANGFSQVALSALPGLGGLTDTNLWLELTSDELVLAFATVIHNGSGDPFAVIAVPDAAEPPRCTPSSQDDVPNNNNFPQVTLPVGGSRTAELNDPRDSDWFLVTLSAQQRYTFSITSSCVRSPTITVRATSGQFLAGNDPAGPSATPTVSYTPSSSMQVFAVVQDWGEQDVGSYTISAAVQ